MLVLDPSHSPAQMAQFNSTSSALGAMRLVRKSIAAMKARQYQVVAVTGIMETDLEYHVKFYTFIYHEYNILSQYCHNILSNTKSCSLNYDMFNDFRTAKY